MNIQELESAERQAWHDFKIAEDSIKPKRDVWLGLNQSLQREKLREEVMREINAEQPVIQQ